jgi:hypothetical protein
MKEKIKNCAANCLNELQKLLPELIFHRANAFGIEINKYLKIYILISKGNKLSSMNAKIAVHPTTVE